MKWAPPSAKPQTLATRELDSIALNATLSCRACGAKVYPTKLDDIEWIDEWSVEFAYETHKRKCPQLQRMLRLAKKLSKV